MTDSLATLVKLHKMRMDEQRQLLVKLQERLEQVEADITTLPEPVVAVAVATLDPLPTQTSVLAKLGSAAAGADPGRACAPEPVGMLQRASAGRSARQRAV